ncbi:M1 family metallopeptidase [Gordonia jinhuaensis]|uniref:M1 family metallopeptidase n=1 Tax=Gordonia jinhuaensis TaxID=1517702 RepID=UPI001E3ADB1D|nr:M1 family metallopeptidase [Gordonia jinhuaensis]
MGHPNDGIDPYLPNNGNLGYRVSRYDLDLQYKVASNRLAGTATITATTLNGIGRFSLDFSTSFKIEKITVNGKRPSRYSHHDNKLSITPSHSIAPGAAMEVQVRYSGSPKPIRGPWGEVGWEELTDGAICASQPNGAASWFPCDDHPSSKAPYHISISTESQYYAASNGVLVNKRAKAGYTTWEYEQTEPMSTYLATMQIGPYERKTLSEGDVPIYAVLPARLKKNFESSFGRQVQIMDTFREMFGPYPFPQYTVVVTDDDLEIPVEAESLSVFGANHCTGTRRSERLVAHELAHQWFGNSVTLRQWRDIWLHEGFACYAEWLWSQAAGDDSTEALAKKYYDKLASSPQDIQVTDPGPDDMFDDRIYKRGALTLHALRNRIGDDKFFELMKKWTSDHRYENVSTDDFTALAGRYANGSLNDIWQSWLVDTRLPAFPYS